jgi:hexosaminidase
MISIIPKPVKLIEHTGKFVLDGKTIIEVDSTLNDVAKYLKNLLKPATQLDVQIKDISSGDKEVNEIVLRINDSLSKLGTEGYVLQVSQERILIEGVEPAGVFYGVQTLRQLLPVEIESASVVNNKEWSVPCVEIEDYPRFPWRGFMLDVGRHFFDKELVKKMLDLMSLHKMNMFHWHLTEDQGWRIEIKKYPKLIEVGSKRKETQIGGILSKKSDGKPHEGFFTHEDIKEVVSYATERFIKVVPEIDMPGHIMSALAAYPELSCTGGPFEVSTRFGIRKDVCCVGKDSTYDFLEDVLNEVIELFPSQIIHLGGDEVPKARWEECSDCQARMKKEGIEDEKELQDYFTNRIVDYISSRGRTAMGWNQVLSDTLKEDVIGQFWMFNKNEVLDHLKKGRKMVMSDYFHTYLDYSYIMTPLRKTYLYEPVPKKLEKEKHANVLGIETPLWTEWVETLKRLGWQIFPRFTAIAEVGWTPKSERNFKSFKKRLDFMLMRLDILGMYHAQKNEFNPRFLKRFIGLIKRHKKPDI